MKYKVDKEGAKPAYLQLYEQIRDDIVGKVYPYGAKLPSKRLLAEESGVSVITAEHAYAILGDEGYVEARKKSGYYVIYKADDFISSSSFKPHEIVPKPSAHSDRTLFPLSVLTKTMRKVILDYGENILIKSPSKGCPELRDALCAYLARSCGINTKPEQIVIGSGAEYLYSLAAQLLGNDKVFAIEDPSYRVIEQVYTASGIKCEKLKLGKNGIESPELEKPARVSSRFIHSHISIPT